MVVGLGNGGGGGQARSLRPGSSWCSTSRGGGLSEHRGAPWWVHWGDCDRGAGHAQRERGPFFSCKRHPSRVQEPASDRQMPQLYESSGLLSLAALREHEKRQALEQAEAARLRAESEQRARLDAEREQARLEQERRSAEHAALQLAEAEQRAELARFDAVRRAELARADALSRSAAELSQQLELERTGRRNAELQFTEQLNRQRLLKSLASALCVGSWLAASALYFGALRPRTDLALSAAQQALLVEQSAHREAETNGVRSLRRNEDLAGRIETLQQELREARAVKPATPPPGAAPQRPLPPRPPHVTAPQQPCRDDGDPLNPCLKH